MSVSDTNSKGAESLPEPVPPGIVQEGKQDRSANVIILILFILLLAAIGYVLILLPDLISLKPSDSTTSAELRTAQTPVQPPPEKGSTSLPPEQNPLPGIREALFKLKIQAEAENINSWAAEEYRNALENETDGNRYFNARNYEHAAASYRLAIEKVAEILESRESRLSAALDEGRSALDKGKSDEAEKQFRLALALSPAEEQAISGLQKVKVLRQTSELLSEITVLTDSGKLREAETKIEQLLSLDPENPEGKNKRETIRRQRAEIDFNSKMSVVFSSLKTGDLRTAFETLEKLKAQWNTHPQFAQAAGILRELKETQQITELLKKAELLIRKENWKDALATYEDILEIAPEALLALNGVKTAGERNRLDIALSESIAKPDRLQDINQREIARKLLEYARRIEPSGPKLRAQTAELERLLAIMSTPIALTIISDNLTEITIYRVGRLGHFFNRSLSLTPGNYTVVGTRRGYRDIRKVIELNPETKDLRITVQCNEPI